MNCPACLGDNLTRVKNKCYRCDKNIIYNDNYDPWGDFKKLLKRYKIKVKINEIEKKI